MFSFFLLITPPPPRSTLFPYTTLFRSFGQISQTFGFGKLDQLVGIKGIGNKRLIQVVFQPNIFNAHKLIRSEEHTSELQSRPHLVCRLLLEKKKNTMRTNHNQS